MQKLIWLSIVGTVAMAGQAFGDTWDLWKSCPENAASYSKRLAQFDTQAGAEFGDLSGSKLQSIYRQGDRQGALLRYISPYLLPSSITAEVDKGCWVFFQDFKEGMDESQMKTAEEGMSSWKTCLEVTYREIPPQVKPLIACFEKIDKR